MKKLRTSILCCAIATVVTCMSLFAGCGLFGGGGSGENNTPTDPVVYKIQYTDDAGVHTIEVEDGDPYSIEAIPQREGYEFIGLFDAEIGGTQYVSANGSSISPFTDKKNLVLFPQYKANQYTVVLNYGGAAVTGQRQFNVNYNESLPELPKNLTLEHSSFSGWYTAENCGGTQIADQYGLIPIVSVVNSENFDLSSQYINLYAGFAKEQLTVTFNFDNGIQSKELKVDYDTPISQVVPDVRNSEGEAVLTWSKSQDGSQIFNGNITDNIVLYAVEWAPVIELNANGGEEITPVIAREGASITLPTPLRENYKFMGWQTSKGDIAEIDTMPAGGANLTAKWQAMLIFDENGGTEVDDISQATGTAITLPTPQKEGYVFAGWYTSDKTQYNATSMPAASVSLKAGWYKAEETTITIIANDLDEKVTDDNNTLSANKRIKINLSDLIPSMPGGINISYSLYFRWGNTYKYYSAEAQVALYDGADFNSSNQITHKNLSHGADRDSYDSGNISGTAIIHNQTIYFYYAGEGDGKISLTGGYGYSVAFYDVYINITYPDTTNLYL